MKCRDDLTAITRYVTWNLDERGSGAMSRALPDKTDMVAVYQVALKSSTEEEKNEGKDGKNHRREKAESQALTPVEDKTRVDKDYQNLMQLMQEAMMSRDANRTNLVVGGLVQHIVSHWREQFCQCVTTKFNCFFMLPFVDDFHRFIRRELQNIYNGDGNELADVFDLSAARRSLQHLRDELTEECAANKRLQDKFQFCARMMRQTQDEIDISDVKPAEKNSSKRRSSPKKQSNRR